MKIIIQKKEDIIVGLEKIIAFLKEKNLDTTKSNCNLYLNLINSDLIEDDYIIKNGEIYNCLEEKKSEITQQLFLYWKAYLNDYKDNKFKKLEKEKETINKYLETAEEKNRKIENIELRRKKLIDIEKQIKKIYKHINILEEIDTLIKNKKYRLTTYKIKNNYYNKFANEIEYHVVIEIIYNNIKYYLYDIRNTYAFNDFNPYENI